MLEFLTWWTETWWRAIFAVFVCSGIYLLLESVITYTYNTGVNIVNLLARNTRSKNEQHRT